MTTFFNLDYDCRWRRNIVLMASKIVGLHSQFGSQTHIVIKTVTRRTDIHQLRERLPAQRPRELAGGS
jgi:hypothetical protein